MTRLAIVLIVASAAACSKKASAPKLDGTTAQIDAAPGPVPVLDAEGPPRLNDAVRQPTNNGPIPASTQVVITSITADWDAVPSQLAEYRRDASGAWQQVRTWIGVVGNTGLAWGKGLHGNGMPEGQSGPKKTEGDGKAPAGVFALGASYGYGAAAPPNAALPYTQVDKSWHCVDDPDSKSYNQIVDTDQVAKDWKSAEDMKRKDALYTWVIAVDHNPERLPGEGSCIFLHVWRTASEGTVGCTAMQKTDIEQLLGELDPKDHPVLVQLPAPLYEQLADAWQLPAR